MTTVTMDRDYLAAFADAAGAATERRARAMQQWITVRTDSEFANAVTRIRSADDGPWHRFWDRHRLAVVAQLRVTEGEPLTPTPLALVVDRAALAEAAEAVGDRLVAALATLNVDDVMMDMQHHDPLSRHCNRPLNFWPTAPDGGAPRAPRPRIRATSPPAKRPQYPADVDPGHSVRRPSAGSILVTFDTLIWPPSRRVALPPPVKTTARRHRSASPVRHQSRSMLPTSKRRRTTSRKFEYPEHRV